MVPILFRNAEKTDIPVILGIYNFYLSMTTSTFDQVELTEEELLQRIFIGNEMYPTYLITIDDKLAGFCFLTQFRNKPAYNRTVEIGLYLKPQFTGKGFGKTILAYLEREAIKRKVRVIIASVSNENTASITLLQTMGYTRCAHYKQIAEKFGRILDVIDYQKLLVE